MNVFGSGVFVMFLLMVDIEKSVTYKMAPCNLPPCVYSCRVLLLLIHVTIYL